MNIWILLLMFIVGVVLVIKGGDVFVDAASWLARSFGIPSFIIGATIVSIATTMPEMLVSMMAAAQGKVDMAIGNAVGSVTANTGLILATGMLFMHIAIKRREYILQCLLLIASAAFLIVSSRSGALSIPGSVVLILIFIAFMAYNVRTAKSKSSDAPVEKPSRKGFAVNIIKFILGAAAIVAGSELLITSGSGIAEFLGIPERIIAITIVAIGTSLPELVTTITAIVKKESALSVGNLIGANIIDLALILPMCSVVSGKPIPVSAMSLTIDMPVCLGILLVAFIPMLIRQKASRIQGTLLIALYAGYLVVIL